MSAAQNAVLLVPNAITPTMIEAGATIPEVDTAGGEAAWVSGTAYTGMENRINYGGSLWAAVAASTGVKPGTNPDKWRRTGPSNRMAPFDDQINTQARAAGTLTYVLKPGFFTGLALYGLVGETLDVTLYESPGGPVVYQWQGDLFEQAMGLFEYLYMPLRLMTKRMVSDLPLAPEAELHITITASSGGECAIGMIVCGFWASLLGGSDFPGGVEMGASATVKTYSYIKTEDDGTTAIIPRSPATNINCSVVIDAAQANYAHDLLTQVAAKPVAIILSGLPRYEYLNTFGLISGSVEAAGWGYARLSISGKGFI